MKSRRFTERLNFEKELKSSYTLLLVVAIIQVNLLRHPKLAVVKREHETGRNFQFWWRSATTHVVATLFDHHESRTSGQRTPLIGWKPLQLYLSFCCYRSVNLVSYRISTSRPYTVSAKMRLA